mgnify:CR=1 FL=1
MSGSRVPPLDGPSWGPVTSHDDYPSRRQGLTPKTVEYVEGCTEGRAVHRDRARKPPVHRVVAEQVGQGGGVGQIVHADDLEIPPLRGAQDEPADPADPTHLTCVQCHDPAQLPQHMDGVHSERHLEKMACETCHITRSAGITYSMYGHGGHVSFGRNEQGQDTKVITLDHMVAEEGVPGDIDADDMDTVADLADRYSLGEIRVSHRQNLAFVDVRQRDLFELWQALDKLDLARPVLDGVSDMICCPGGDFCSLANAKSIPVAQALQERFEAFARDVIGGEPPPPPLAPTTARPPASGSRWP